MLLTVHPWVTPNKDAFTPFVGQLNNWAPVQLDLLSFSYHMHELLASLRISKIDMCSTFIGGVPGKHVS